MPESLNWKSVIGNLIYFFPYAFGCKKNKYPSPKEADIESDITIIKAIKEKEKLYSTITFFESFKTFDDHCSEIFSSLGMNISPLSLCWLIDEFIENNSFTNELHVNTINLMKFYEKHGAKFSYDLQKFLQNEIVDQNKSNSDIAELLKKELHIANKQILQTYIEQYLEERQELKTNENKVPSYFFDRFESLIKTSLSHPRDEDLPKEVSVDIAGDDDSPLVSYGSCVIS